MGPSSQPDIPAGRLLYPWRVRIYLNHLVKSVLHAPHPSVQSSVGRVSPLLYVWGAWMSMSTSPPRTFPLVRHFLLLIAHNNGPPDFSTLAQEFRPGMFKSSCSYLILLNRWVQLRINPETAPLLTNVNISRLSLTRDTCSIIATQITMWFRPWVVMLNVPRPGLLHE